MLGATTAVPSHISAQKEAVGFLGIIYASFMAVISVMQFKNPWLKQTDFTTIHKLDILFLLLFYCCIVVMFYCCIPNQAACLHPRTVFKVG